jgi:hypothetical protein
VGRGVEEFSSETREKDRLALWASSQKRRKEIFKGHRTEIEKFGTSRKRQAWILRRNRKSLWIFNVFGMKSRCRKR